MTHILFKIQWHFTRINSLKKILGWMDRLTKSERALQNGNEECEEWVWSGQMCSNVFWPVFCMDKSISTHSLSHTHTSQSASISAYLCFLMLGYGGGQKKVNVSFLYPVSSSTLKSGPLPFITCSHNHVGSQTYACIRIHPHTIPVYMERNLMCHPAT